MAKQIDGEVLEIRREVTLTRIHTQRALTCASRALGSRLRHFPQSAGGTLVLDGGEVRVVHGSEEIRLPHFAPRQTALDVLRILRELDFILPDGRIFLNLATGDWELE